jgi:hypothetical protein
MYSIYDESNYLGMAYVLKQSTVFPDAVGMKFVSLLQHRGRLLSLYPIGTSLLLTPFTMIGWNYAFLLNFLLLLFSFFFFLRILAYYKLSPLYSLLFLYYPPLCLYMRTVMSDIPSTFLVIAGFYAYLLGNRWLYCAGLLFGFSILMRHSNNVIVGSLIMIMIYQVVKAIKSKNDVYKNALPLLKFLTGFIPFVIFTLCWNYYMLGTPLRTPYYYASSHNSSKLLPVHFLFYCIALSSMYPLMLFTLLLYKNHNKNKLLLNVLFWPLFILYCFVKYSPDFGIGVEKIVVGMRYLLPVVYICVRY